MHAKQRAEQELGENTELKLAYTVPQFAALFEHHQVWGYRQLYSGRVRILDQPGRILIPRSEVERFLSRVIEYSGRPSRPQKGQRQMQSATPNGGIAAAVSCEPTGK